MEGNKRKSEPRALTKKKREKKGCVAQHTAAFSPVLQKIGSIVLQDRQ